jgi:hypothetical protein
MFIKIGRILIIAFIVGLILLPAIPVSAYTSQPDETPKFTEVHVNRNLITTGDAMIYGMYELHYHTIPDVAADQTYIISVMNSAKTITYGFTTPFVYHDKGYGKGAISIYLAPDTITWEQSLYIRIAQVPDQFETPVNTDISVLANKYTTFTTQSDNQAEVAANLFTIGQTLETEYDAQFFTNSDGRNVLTDPGEAYFRGAIPGLQGVAPDLFLIQTDAIDFATKQYTTEQFTTYQTRFTGTWVGSAMDAGGDMLGMGGNTFMMFIFTLPLCIGAVVFTSLKFKKSEPGFILAALFMIMAAIMGWMPMALFATVFQLFGIYIGYLLFYSRSSGGLDSKLLSFTVYCYFISIIICVILEGTYFGADERSIFNGIGFLTTFNLPIVGDVPVFDVNFIQSFGRILTWDYSFYSGSYEILRWFWFSILSCGPAWGLVQFFVNLIPSIIAIFRPSIAV